VISEEIFPVVYARLIFFVTLQLVEDECDDSEDQEEGCESAHRDGDSSDGGLAFSDEVEVIEEVLVVGHHVFRQVVPREHHSVVWVEGWEGGHLARSARRSATKNDKDC